MTTPTTAEQMDIEAVARCVYEAMRVAASPFVETPRWTEGGNSTRQDEARRAAARIVALVGDNAALSDARATIARLEGELNAWRTAGSDEPDVIRALRLSARPGSPTEETAINVLRYIATLRTRADAAERRVQAVMGDAAVEAAARALCDGFRVVHIDGENYQLFDNCMEEGKNVWRGLAKLTIAAALAAASGDTATTEG